MPRSGKTTDHDVESVVIGFGYIGKKMGSVMVVFEVNDSGEK